MPDSDSLLIADNGRALTISPMGRFGGGCARGERWSRGRGVEEVWGPRSRRGLGPRSRRGLGPRSRRGLGLVRQNQFLVFL